jgi:hypothetical protein
MQPLKIFDAVEEVLQMDDLQLRWQRKNGWKYLEKSLAELREYLVDNLNFPLQLSSSSQHVQAPSHAPRPRARHGKKGVS